MGELPTGLETCGRKQGYVTVNKFMLINMSSYGTRSSETDQSSPIIILVTLFVTIRTSHVKLDHFRLNINQSDLPLLFWNIVFQSLLPYTFTKEIVCEFFPVMI